MFRTIKKRKELHQTTKSIQDNPWLIKYLLELIYACLMILNKDETGHGLSQMLLVVWWSLLFMFYNKKQNCISNHTYFLLQFIRLNFFKGTYIILSNGEVEQNLVWQTDDTKWIYCMFCFNWILHSIYLLRSVCSSRSFFLLRSNMYNVMFCL